MNLEMMVSSFVTLFVVIDPIGIAPLFLALTPDMDQSARTRVANRALVLSFALLAIFGLFGEAILSAFGIGIPAFRISGGILLFLTALDMLFEKRTERREKTSDTSTADPSVFPLAIPLLAGPSALAAMILLTSSYSGDYAAQAGIFVVMAAVLATTWLFLRLAGRLGHALGPGGTLVVTRLFGVLLAALSVQFILDGLRDSGLISG